MKKYGEKEKYPPLYDVFELGDRVKRCYKGKNGKNKEYRGIVLAIDDHCMEIYWDTENGKYRPKDMDIAFTNCTVEEVFGGNKKYTPIEKEKGRYI